MKRWFGVMLIVCASAAAVAQAPFTIVRPADGSKVREKVHILIPKNSIPQGGYVGLFLNGKFLEATVPPLNGKYYDYVLDTKGKALPDGPATLEAVLYVDYKENPRIVDRSSVNITVANTANIPIPEGGIRLRYRYPVGTEMTYKITQTVTVATISGSQNLLGGHPAEEERANESIRMMYAVDNAYSNGDGLIRIQPLPPKGKDYTFLTTSLNPDGAKYYADEMHPTYMRLDSTGREKFGAVPSYFPMEGTSGPSSRTDLFAPYPLPVLPSKPVRPGSSWATSFQQPEIDLAKLYDTNTLVSIVPARGEFVGVEWEMGHPCAKIRHTIAAGTKTKGGAALAALGRSFSDQKIELDETIWFALDKRQVLKVIRNQTVDEKVETSGSMGGGLGAPGGGAPGAAPGGPGGPGIPGRGPGGKGSGGGVGSITGSMRQGVPGRPGGAPGGLGRPGGGGQGGPGRSGGGGGGTSQYIRIRLQQLFVLEQ